MAFLFLSLLMQASLSYQLLQVEDSRTEYPSALLEALSHSDRSIQRQAVRALGRFERAEFAAEIRPLLSSPYSELRSEAVNALGQMGVSDDFAALLETERDPSVRATLYRTIGRVAGTDEALLAAGLSEQPMEVRIAAAHGLGAFLRGQGRNVDASDETLVALRRAARDETDAVLRRLAFAALNSAGDSDMNTLESGLTDPDAQVRRLAVIASGEWIEDDPSYIVRYETFRQAATCDRARASLEDESEHVVLLAIDQLAEQGCGTQDLLRIADDGSNWRRSARAFESLSRIDADAALERLDRFVNDPRPEARAAAARVARALGNAAALSPLVADFNPRVVTAALDTSEDAVVALGSSDYGLIMRATAILGQISTPSALPALVEALDRVTGDRAATSRDPRTRLLDRIREVGSDAQSSRLEPLLDDIDPEIARLAAEILSEWSGRPVAPRNVRYDPEPIPEENVFRALDGATARVTMSGGDSFLLELFPEEAPVTVATFARLASEGYYDGLTFHRVEPNFVIQGGSPAADEYVGNGPFMRDELGLLSHDRGTVGISTRGRDTGDAQIFMNLVDNPRLDHNYTVFARVSEGIDVVDRILAGDVIESVRINRR